MADPVVLLFPGQGLQFVGMGKALAEQFAEARAVFEEAEEALHLPLRRLCWEGPEEELTRTEHAQPAILTHAIAALRAVQARSELQVTAAAGHSLGEWTALVAAGALDLRAAVRLVHLRGRLMQEAVPQGQGAMSTILGLEREAIEGACAEAAQGEIVVVATYNDASHCVISGHSAAVERAAAACLERGAMRVVPLPVSAPFHSPLMAPAAARLAEALQDVAWAPRDFAVRSTIVDAWLQPSDDLSDLLVRQMTAPVLWQQAVAALAADGATRALALGPASAMPGLVKRTARGLKTVVLSEPADVERLSA